MKAASTALATFLNTSDQAYIVDLYTITLVGGEVIRWSGGDQSIFANGFNFVLGPAINRTKLTNARGVTASTLSVTILADALDTIDGVPLVTYLQGHGLDGALLRIDRAYCAKGPPTPVGTLIWFMGKVTKITGLTRSQATVNAADWRTLLNVNMPADLYSPGCRHALFDSGCTLSRAAYLQAGTVSGTVTKSTFGSALSNPVAYFDQGYLTFTSGANNGLTRAVKSYDGAGHFVVMPELPVAPTAGDTFNAFPGCDFTKATCGTRFNNVLHMGGQPFIPVPEVAVG